jgi:hypothetical protein
VLSGLFSQEDLAQLADKDWLLRKQHILHKVEQLLGEVERHFHHQLSVYTYNLPKKVKIQSGKISRGENLSSLPYRVLDFPRYFSSDQFYTFRTLFHWGHGFSCSLATNVSPFQLPHTEHMAELRFLTGPQPWVMAGDHPSWLPMHHLSPNEIQLHIHQHGYLHLRRELSIDEWHNLPKWAWQTFQMLHSEVKN